MFNLQDYVDFNKLFQEGILNKEYAGEKYLKVSVHNGKAIIRYQKEHLNKDNVKTLGMFRSVVYHIESNQVISFSPPKSISYEDFSKDHSYEEVEPLNFVEGTMINMFWDPTTNDIEISTKSNIGANCYYSVEKNKTSFNDMFSEIFSEIAKQHDQIVKTQYEDSDPGYYDCLHNIYPAKRSCFSFVMQHKNNRIVTKIKQNALYLVGIYEIDGFVVTPQYGLLTNYQTIVGDVFKTSCWYDGINKYKAPYYDSHNFDELKSNFEEYDYEYDYMGIVLYSPTTGCHTKLRNPSYEYVRRLKGNNMKPQYRFHELLKEGDNSQEKVLEYLSYFPEYKCLFDCFQDDIDNIVKQLYSKYVDCFIHHKYKLKNTTYQYKPHLYELHNRYINILKPIGTCMSKLYVRDYVYNLEIPRLMYFTNYNLKFNRGTFNKDNENDKFEGDIEMGMGRRPRSEEIYEEENV